MSKQISPAENGKFEMILRSAVEFPGVKINRSSFLKKQLSKHFPESVVEKAISTNPAQAGLSIEDIKPIAKACISRETTEVTSLSAIAGIPGGLAMVGTIPVDIAQFFGHIIRVLQKLIYLYGWQELFNADEDELDDETYNQLILFMGVMFGVKSASAVIEKIAGAVALKAEKSLVQKALTKGTIYPIVKTIARIIGVRMTKQIFARGIGKIIPVVGAVASGGITFIAFRPFANRLQKYLIELPMANVEFYNQPRKENDIVIDIDFSDIVIEDLDDIDAQEESGDDES